MAKAISFISHTTELSEHDYFLELLIILGNPLNTFPNQTVNSLSIEQKSILLSSSMSEYSNEFIQYLFDELLIRLITWESFNPTGMINSSADSSYKSILDIAKCYEEETFDEEFNVLFNELQSEFLSNKN